MTLLPLISQCSLYIVLVPHDRFHFTLTMKACFWSKKECLEKFNHFHFPQDEHFIFVLYLSKFYPFILLLLFLKTEKLCIWLKNFTTDFIRKTTGTLPFFQAHISEVNYFNHFFLGYSGGYIWKSKQWVYATLLATSLCKIRKFNLYSVICLFYLKLAFAIFPGFDSHYFPFSHKSSLWFNTRLST